MYVFCLILEPPIVSFLTQVETWYRNQIQVKFKLGKNLPMCLEEAGVCLGDGPERLGMWEDY